MWESGEIYRRDKSVGRIKAKPKATHIELCERDHIKEGRNTQNTKGPTRNDSSRCVLGHLQLPLSDRSLCYYCIVVVFVDYDTALLLVTLNTNRLIITCL